MSKRKIVPILTGGLGNQLFQFAFAYALSRKYNAVVSCDIHTGYISDQYNRSFQLKYLFPGIRVESRFRSIVSFIMLKMSSALHHVKQLGFAEEFPSVNPKIFYFSSHALLTEVAPLHNCELELSTFSSLRMSGYFQSLQLFEKEKNSILDLFDNYIPSTQAILDLGAEISSQETVALGIRLYEETSRPELNAHDHKLKSLTSVNDTLQKILDLKPSCQVALFCSHHSDSFNQLVLPEHTLFLTGDHLVPSPIDTLWLISKCQHHLFLNSSLYWWGAFLSQNNFPAAEQIIYAADNFINQNCYPTSWNKF